MTSNNTDNRSYATRLAAKIAVTPRRSVDSQGRPQGSGYVYTYDDAGHLIAAVPDEIASKIKPGVLDKS